MIMYRVNIKLSYKCGGWSIDFKKTIELPFTPFYGLDILIDRNNEQYVRLHSNDYCDTSITWDDEYQDFDVRITTYWKANVSNPSIVDETLEQFKNWERVDKTNIDSYKKILYTNYK